MRRKPVNFLHPFVFAARTRGMGRGMFTREALPRGVLLEIAPVIVMSGTERKLLDETLLHDYIFEWGEDQQQCCMALGYVPLYNHSYQSNCEYEMDFKKEIISIRSVRKIKAGEELFINYNGGWNNRTPVWFEVK
ncbi:MAG: SET domain-containing protein-lysine N-methyltransferase [Flavisolibacter sp.]|nr:SET domain-containing protein-lysine N-methyltransferase [Flavisolibacter sp.]MBD0287107.1 SET domain-containing protein-lysine N-methyltransferase [Flavisolibacter sp.]MBD0295120.1 SET domain-containing protein-lysine N-methyltransferase [Flavisolibacter sp.]MBD0352060.1 SET domain-containing protein-lysine N-methyltransferase [Flavisolibacter sp.]MBD0377618.1 SET domain-containing protein-lysine N-methyltransferase [Flavisolibacter sp.]